MDRKELVEYAIKSMAERLEKFVCDPLVTPEIDLYSASVDQLKTRYHFLSLTISKMRTEQIDFEKETGSEDLEYENKITSLAKEKGVIGIMLMHLLSFDDYIANEENFEKEHLLADRTIAAQKRRLAAAKKEEDVLKKELIDLIGYENFLKEFPEYEG